MRASVSPCCSPCVNPFCVSQVPKVQTLVAGSRVTAVQMGLEILELQRLQAKTFCQYAAVLFCSVTPGYGRVNMLNILHAKLKRRVSAFRGKKKILKICSETATSHFKFRQCFYVVIFMYCCAQTFLLRKCLTGKKAVPKPCTNILMYLKTQL